MLKFKILDAIFLPRRYLQVKTGVTPPVNKNIGIRQWIVGRDLCLYHLFKLTDIPSAERKSAVDIHIRQWSPFTDPGSYVVWKEDMAQVWIWDEAERSLAAEENGVVKALVMPETLLQPAPEKDAIRLVSCAHGVDGQIWKKGVLVASHWWSVPSVSNDWPRFLAANDCDPHMTMEKPETHVFLRQPWGRSSMTSRALFLPHERGWVSALFLLLAFFLVWQMVSLWKWQNYQHDLEKEVAALTSKVQPLLNARSQALQDRQAAVNLASLTAYPSMLELWAAMIEKQVGKDVKMVAWHYTKGKLNFTLQGKNLDLRLNVKAFQGHPFFSDVTVEKGRNSQELTISMTVNK